MLTVATVLKSGGIYSQVWVDRLAKAIRRHLSQRHNFVCLSDVDVPCERIPLEHNWPGWWAKIEVLRLEGPVLYFDLDTVIVGDLTDVAQCVEVTPFIMLRDFCRPDGLGSGMMAWNAFDVSAIYFYDRFMTDPAAWMSGCPGGDQEFIERVSHMPGIFRWQDAVPGQIVSYKADRCRERTPQNARVICFHGQPKPSNCGGWAQELWEQAA